MEPVVTDIPDLQIREEHLPRICEEYETLCEKYLEAYRAGKGFNFFHFNIDLEGGPCLSKRVSACGAGNEYFSVVPNGDIYPCHQFAGNKDFYMGNVFEGKLSSDIRFALCHVLPVHPQGLRKLLCKIHMQRRLQRKQLQLLRQHRTAV